MIKKLDALNCAKQMLNEHNIPDWQQSAEYILAVSLGIDHSDLYKVDNLTEKVSSLIFCRGDT